MPESKFEAYPIFPLVLGTVQLGREYGIANRSGQPATSESLKMLALAAQAGVNTFDTAPNYGDSEDLLGAFLSAWSGPEPWIVTKIVTGAASKLGKNDDPYPLLKKSLQGSQAKLGCKRPPGLILQYAADARQHPKLMDGLLRLKQEGLANSVGLSVYDQADLEFFLDHAEMDIVQAPFNLFDQRLLAYMDDLKARGSLVLARSVYLQGLFFLDPSGLPPEVEPASPYLQRLASLCRELDVSVEELAFLYARDTPGLDGLVIGVESSEQLARNLAMLKLKPLSAEHRLRIENDLKGVPERVINPVLWKTWN
jgi:aryl-alcohol dehydrogenase-like predicted oxidoreductase